MEFHRNRRAKDGRQSSCKVCQSVYDAAYHARHQAQQLVRMAVYRPKVRGRELIRARERYAAMRAKVVALKLTLSCVDCGWRPDSEAAVKLLDFDHRDPSTKHDRPGGQAFKYSWSWSRIIQEIALCDPRCKPCHRRRTSRQNQSRKVAQ
jgi:hypothetical protein